MKKLVKYIAKLCCAFLILYVIVRLMGYDLFGLNLPINLPNLPSITSPTTPIETPDDIKELVKSIRVSTENQTEKYNRDTWEKPNKRYNLNGESLSRVKYAVYTSKWLVSREPFEYLCPYTGKTITDVTVLDYEHLIALNYIHKYGNISWDDNKKNEFAYDLRIGMPVLNSANRSKSDKGPSEWLPNYRNEDFCYSWLWIASTYDIALRQVDIDTCIREIEKGLSNGETLELLMQYK